LGGPPTVHLLACMRHPASLTKPTTPVRAAPHICLVWYVTRVHMGVNDTRRARGRPTSRRTVSFPGTWPRHPTTARKMAIGVEDQVTEGGGLGPMTHLFLGLARVSIVCVCTVYPKLLLYFFFDIRWICMHDECCFRYGYVAAFTLLYGPWVPFVRDTSSVPLLLSLEEVATKRIKKQRKYMIRCQKKKMAGLQGAEEDIKESHAPTVLVTFNWG
jgi:hypothetical protein